MTVYNFLTSENKEISCKILYEDNHLIAAVKPAGVLSQSDGSSKPDMLTILKSYIKIKYNKPGNVFLGLVHRLDMPVSGIMVFARTSKAASRLSAQIREKKFEKRYLAVISGRMDKPKDELRNKLLKLKTNKVIEDPEGKESILEYSELSFNEDTNNSLVDIILITGRSHQIRVQFAISGHPLKGDMKYSKEPDNINFNNEYEIALFAYKLSFLHPVSRLPVNLAVFPDDDNYFREFNEIFKNIDGTAAEDMK